MILKLNMAVFIILLTLLQVSSALYGPRLLAGEVGGSVTIKCFYQTTKPNSYDRKYWCKISGARRVCNTIISTSAFISEDYKGRASITDSPKNGTFTVQMTQLKRTDTGVYRCGIGSNNRALFISMNLTVREDSNGHQSPQLVLGKLRGSVTIQCLSENAKSGGRKFWCKLGKTDCLVIADSDGYVGRNYEGRIFITPQESSGTFKILINTLKKEDSGLYKCGIGTPGESGSTRMIDLQVTDESTIPRALRFLSGSVGGMVSAKCHSDPQRTYETKYWCRWMEAGCSLVADTNGFVQDAFEGRIQIISDSQENGTFTVVMRHLEEKDAGWYWCGAKDGDMEQTSSVKLYIRNRPTLSAPVSSISPTTALHNVTSPVNAIHQTFSMGRVTEEILGKTTPEDRLVTFSNAVYESVTSPVNAIHQMFSMGRVTEEILGKTTREDRLVTFSNVVYESVTSPVNVIHQMFSMGRVTEEILGKTTSEERFVTFSNAVYESSSRELQLFPFLIPALILLLLLVAITIFIFIQVKLHRKKVRDRSSVSNLEARVTLTDLKCLEEQIMEENIDPAKQLEPELDHDKEYPSRQLKDSGAPDANVQLFPRRDPLETIPLTTVYYTP